MNYWQKENIITTLIVVIVGLGIFFLVRVAAMESKRVRMETFQAWEKVTGNPSKLTYREYYLLKGEGLLKVVNQGSIEE